MAALLWSVAVTQDYRSKGFATSLVRALLQEARIRGVKSVVLLTSTASTYFFRFGFLIVR